MNDTSIQVGKYEPEVPKPRYVLPVSEATYKEIRALLIAMGQGGLFERWEGGEMINMFDLGIVAKNQ